MAGTSIKTPKRPRCYPLSKSSRRRILRGLLARADAGDARAAEVLVRLSILAETTGTA
jgi:hypothetical protein